MDSPEIEIIDETVPESTECKDIEITAIPCESSSGSNSQCSVVEHDTPSVLHTADGTLDWWGKRPLKSATGGKTTATLLLVSYGLVNLAFFGVAEDLVVFLRRVLHQENAEAANNISKWMGTVYIFSLFGAFLSDSYMGRYVTCIVFQLIYLVGLVLLSLSSWLLLVQPPGCGDDGGGQHMRPCAPQSRLGVAMFYLSIYMAALGNGGYQPAVATFGADQFDDTDPRERRSKQAFFCFFYLALNAGSLFSNSALVYFEDRGDWVAGFSASAVAASLAFVLFLLGSPYYRHFRPAGNPLTRIAQVCVAAFRKRHIMPPPGDQLHEVDPCEYSRIRGARKLLHRDQLRFLDKAAATTEEDYHAGNGKNPWRLCTVTQVEEVKCIVSMIPIWVCTIIYSVEFTQMSSMFVEQGAAMDTNLFDRFKVPAAIMSLFDIVSVLVSVAAYRYLLVPAASRLTKNPRGITELQRMGTGLVVALLGMVAAAVVEAYRRRPSKRRRMSVLWQAPQYALIGVSEVFMYVGQLEFFNGQVPDGVKSLGSALCMASMSLGNYASILMVSAVNGATARGRRSGVGWIPATNLNRGHLDRFFLVIAALSAVDLVVFIVFAVLYKGIKFDGT